MLDFMDYVQAAFHSTTQWDVDNSYTSLTTTARNLLEFPIPHGVRLRISSLSAPNFATSYTLGSRGVVDGSLAYLYSSIGLPIASRTSDIDLKRLVQGYRHIQELRRSDEAHWSELWYRGERINVQDHLLYGRLYLPASSLEALYLRRLSTTRLLRLACVSDAGLPNGGSMLASLQSDHGKHSYEFLYSTDSSLLGVRGLYNFGYDPRKSAPTGGSPATSTQTSNNVIKNALNRVPAHPWDHQNGRLSAGAELYFSPINKSGGLSTGLRFTTLPVHTGFPYTMTLTVNPLMGNLSATYASKAGRWLSLCSSFDFNVYSYESDVVVGMELWQQKRKKSVFEDVSWAAEKIARGGWETAGQIRGDFAPTTELSQPPNSKQITNGSDDQVNGVLKARMDISGKLGILWECKVKDLVLSLGAGLDIKKRERMLVGIGLDISYSS